MLYHFSHFVLDSRRRELRRGTDQIPLEPQVFDLLEFLIRARNRVVSRDELLDAVWRGRTVSDATLSSRVNAARSAIGDTGEAQRLIRTLPRKGIRFVGDVREATDLPPFSWCARHNRAHWSPAISRLISASVANPCGEAANSLSIVT